MCYGSDLGLVQTEVKQMCQEGKAPVVHSNLYKLLMYISHKSCWVIGRYGSDIGMNYNAIMFSVRQ